MVKEQWSVVEKRKKTEKREEEAEVLAAANVGFKMSWAGAKFICGSDLKVSFGLYLGSRKEGQNWVSTIPLVVEEILVLPSTNADVSLSPQQDNADVSSPHKNRADLSSSPQIDRADVSSSQPFNENENRDLNQNQSPLVEEQSPLVEEQAPAPRVEEHSDSDSLYDIDENIDDLSDLDEELLQARQSNIQEQVKEKTARVNLDEIPSSPVGIDAGFEDIYKEKRGRFEGNLGGDDLYFDNSDPGSDISEDEGDLLRMMKW
ncbi:hypothetical protein H5410_060178 [Solanum commersonii]|uniref:Uncharacterized protein n=1 Tax=Solanum commersonii TaxID=4109 RepID=A0A9J5W575_SOLCO|nr:hypothetical protein H5410_060178 [Solanum commersonii]